MESEQELLLDNPSQFVQLAIDTCEEQVRTPSWLMALM